MYYDELAPGYDELHEEEQKKKVAIVAQRMSIGDEEKVLDVGCGTGVSSMIGGKVTGIDPSSGLLKKAEERGIETVVGRAEELPFEDAFFDVVISITAAQLFSDLERGLREIIRVGKGRYAISILKKSAKRRRFEELIKRLLPAAVRIEEEKDIIFIQTYL